MFNKFFFSESHAVYQIMWKKQCIVGQATDGNVALAHCMLVLKVTRTHSQYVIHVAFPLQKWLRDRASMLHNTYIACIVVSYK
jgi:hypothetical protein